MAVQYDTPQALKLSSIIQNKVGEYYGKYTDPNSNVYNAFSASENNDVMQRVNGILGHICVAYGIQEYLNNYCNIPLTANGYAQGTEIAFSNQNGSTVGLIAQPNIDYYPLYMMPMILRTDNKYLTNNPLDPNYDPQAQLKAMKNFFRAILNWISVPFLECNSHFINDKFYFDSELYFGFGPAYDIVDSVANEIVNKLTSMGNDITFEKSWNVLAAGIIEILNNNEIYSKSVDVGVGAVYTGTMLTSIPLLPPYFGFTKGIANFGSDYYLNMDVTLTAGPLGLPDIKVPFSVKVFPNFPSITYKDKTTDQNKTIQTNYKVEKVEGSISNILDNVENAIKSAINRESNVLYRRLKKESNLTDLQIAEKIVDLMKTIQPMMNSVCDYIMSNLDKPITDLAKIMTRIIRITFWSTTLASPAFTAPLPYGYPNLYMVDALSELQTTIPDVNKSIDNILTDVGTAKSNFGKVGTQSLNDILISQAVNLGVQTIYFPDQSEVFSFTEINADQAKIADFVILIGNVIEVVGNAKKVANDVVKTGVDTTYTTLTAVNQGLKNNPSPAISGPYITQETAYNALKITNPLPQSDVFSAPAIDFAIQQTATTLIKTAFDIYANGKKNAIAFLVNSINIIQVLQRLQNDQNVY